MMVATGNTFSIRIQWDIKSRSSINIEKHLKTK